MTTRRRKAEPKDIPAEVFDEHGESRSVFKFSDLSIHPNIATAFRDGFLAAFGHTSVESKRQSWRSIRKLAQCIVDENLESYEKLPSDIVCRFHVWLEAQQLVNSTKQSHFNCARALLLWCSRNAQGAVSADLRLPPLAFVREPASSTAALDEKTIKEVLRAAYREIDEVTARLEAGNRILADDTRNDQESELGVLLRALLSLGGGNIPLQPVINRAGHNYARLVNEHGGLREVGRWLFPSPEDMFPFYLAILCQTIGNPMAIRELRRDCVRPHPLRDDRVAIVWSKPKSAREQKADFSLGRARNAPNLVKQFIDLTKRLELLVPSRKRQLLFLAKTKTGIQVPTFQLFHVLLAEFISRNRLPNFVFKQLRKTGGYLHHAVGGSLLLAKQRLNHRSIRTTVRYTEPEAFREQNDSLIARFQGELVSLCMTGNDPRQSHVQSRESVPKESETAFGFTCKDPFAGIAPGSRPGIACPQFGHCAACPGAVITLDDPAVVARLLGTAKALREAEVRALEAGWSERFNALYKPTLVVIEVDLLSKVSPEVVTIAMALPSPPSPPHIE